jgi:DNA-binding CsgD family transcriptional regulator
LGRTFSDHDAAHPLLPIYDTMTDPSRWTGALDTVAGAVGAVGSLLMVRRLDDVPYEFAALSSIYDPALVAEYKARNLDALEVPQWRYLDSRPPLELVHDDAAVPRAVLDVRADYVMNRERLGIGRRVGVRLNAIRSWYDAAIFAFSADLTDIPESSLRALRPLLPHLAKSAEAGRTFAMLRARYQAALTVLDRVNVGLAVALPSGEIIAHNAEAARIFGCADGLTLGRNGQLMCRDAEQRCKIAGAIYLASGTLRGAADAPEALEAIDRPSGLYPYLVEVTPLADSGGEIERDLAGALVTIVDPDNVPPAEVRRFAALHGLTQAESEVCGLVVQGAPAPEIAERRGEALATARAQMGAVLAKTGAGGRGELIRRVLRTLPPVA